MRKWVNGKGIYFLLFLIFFLKSNGLSNLGGTWDYRRRILSISFEMEGSI
jgi:hypothetical protein